MGTAIWFNHQPIVAGKGRRHAERLAAGVTAAATCARRRSTTTGPRTTGSSASCSSTTPTTGGRTWPQHIGRPELATDEKFATAKARGANMAEAVAILDEVFAQRTLAEWKDALSTALGVWAPVQSPAEIHEDPQTIANGFVREVQYPTGPISLPIPPVLFDEEGGDIERAPDYGEHTDEVLTEIGYTADDIARVPQQRRRRLVAPTACVASPAQRWSSRRSVALIGLRRPRWSGGQMARTGIVVRGACAGRAWAPPASTTKRPSPGPSATGMPSASSSAWSSSAGRPPVVR